MIWRGTKIQKREDAKGHDRVVYEDITEVPFWRGRVARVSEGC